jgi:hypothetical protein
MESIVRNDEQTGWDELRMEVARRASSHEAQRARLPEGSMGKRIADAGVGSDRHHDAKSDTLAISHADMRTVKHPWSRRKPPRLTRTREVAAQQRS